MPAASRLHRWQVLRGRFAGAPRQVVDLGGDGERLLSSARQRAPHPGARPGQAVVYVAFMGLLLLLVAGLALDTGRVLLARQGLLSAADSAAHAGAQQVDLAYYRETAQVRLLTATRGASAGQLTAEQAAGEVLQAAGLPPCGGGRATCASVRIVAVDGGEAVEVSAQQRVTLTLMRLGDLGADSLLIDGVGLARARLRGL